MSGASFPGEQLVLALWPHDGTPLSFLKALRQQLNGLNPDRAQVEKVRYRSAIRMAFRQLWAHAPDQYGAARRLFPGIGLVPDVVKGDVGECEREEGLCPSCLALDEPLLPGMVPTMAPDARRARGTPVSAPALELVSCNRGLTPFPTSVSRRAVSRARSFGIQSNSALA